MKTKKYNTTITKDKVADVAACVLNLLYQGEMIEIKVVKISLSSNLIGGCQMMIFNEWLHWIYSETSKLPASKRQHGQEIFSQTMGKNCE